MEFRLLLTGLAISRLSLFFFIKRCKRKQIKLNEIWYYGKQLLFLDTIVSCLLSFSCIQISLWSKETDNREFASPGYWYFLVYSWAHRSNKGLSTRKRVKVLSTFKTEVNKFFFKKTLNKKYCDIQLNEAHLFCSINFLHC